MKQTINTLPLFRPLTTVWRLWSSDSPFDPVDDSLPRNLPLYRQLREYMSSQFSLPVETEYPRGVLNAP